MTDMIPQRTGRNGREAAEIAAHSTRDGKEVHSPGEVMAAHRKLAADFGHQVDAFVQITSSQTEAQHLACLVVPGRKSATLSRQTGSLRQLQIELHALSVNQDNAILHELLPRAIVRLIAA